jgi:superfamily II DNA or RNA helicase
MAQERTESMVKMDLPALNYGPVRVAVGRIQCCLTPALQVDAKPIGECSISPKVSEPQFTTTSSEVIVITTRKHLKLPAGVDGLLLRGPSGDLRWLGHRKSQRFEAKRAAAQWAELRTERSASWDGAFRYKCEKRSSNGTVEAEGLRPPQIGALHAIGAHWSLYRSPATVVMPTGTGKTETMLCTLASQVGGGTILVVVPSDVLRWQTALKFVSFGLLRGLGVLTDAALNPVVGVVTKRPTSVADLEIFGCCNVVIATMSSVADGVAAGLASEIAARVDTLIVDEAHHIGATNWGAFRGAFKQKRVLQFTATPFRRDGRLVDGEVIFNYPLKMAQADGYFKPISFRPVHEVRTSRADEAIAEAAIAQLGEDIAAGRNHLMMARCVSIDRAEVVHKIYERLSPDLHPMLIHSEMIDIDRRIADLRAGRSRIAVCVNMLGEGFDLPQLKVAAIHDLHKSLAILLQFIGRFTRSANMNIGNATAVANIADANVSAALERLYSEDADWNVVLSELSSDAAKEHAELIEFLKSTERFDEEREDVPIAHQLLRPTLSTLVYNAEDFRPKKFHEGLPVGMVPHRVWFHGRSETLFFVTKSEPGLKWTRAKDVRDREWALFVLHYDRMRKLLFLSSTDHSSTFTPLAKAVGAISIIEGDVMFRTLGRINRLIFQNVGLRKPGRRNLGYAIYTGTDVTEALSIAERGASVKNNVSGTGWEAGRHVGVGCSAKGRVWSREQGPIPRFVKWCDQVGDKLQDASIRTEDIIRNVLIPTAVEKLPDAEVLSLEWPYEMLRFLEEKVVFSDGTRQDSQFNFALLFAGVDRAENIVIFNLVNADGSVWGTFELRIGGPELYTVVQTAGSAVTVTVAKLVQGLAAYFSDYPPLIHFVDLRQLDGNHLIGPQDPRTFTIADERFEAWEWDGVDLKSEATWKGGVERKNSIQSFVARRYSDNGFQVVFDDDLSGEAADLVCLKEVQDHIRLAFIHCKFSGGRTAGERVKDVVEVCSQAVRCAKWNGRFPRLVEHLRSRNEAPPGGRLTRFVTGNDADLTRLAKQSRFKELRAEIVIAQPGLSKSGRTVEQTAVIAAAATYLKETIGVDLDLICSA